MPNPNVLQVLVGISSVLGFLATLAYLYQVYQARRTERSIREIVGGESLFTADQVLETLKLCKTDEAILKALKEFTRHDQAKNKALLEKVGKEISVVQLERLSHRQDSKRRTTAAVLVLILAVIGVIWSLWPAQKATESAVSAPSGPSNSKTDTTETVSQTTAAPVVNDTSATAQKAEPSLVLVLDSKSRSDSMAAVVEALGPLQRDGVVRAKPSFISSKPALVDELVRQDAAIVIVHAHALADSTKVAKTGDAAQQDYEIARQAERALVGVLNAFDERNPQVRFIIYSRAFAASPQEGDRFLERLRKYTKTKNGQTEKQPPFPGRIKTIGIPDEPAVPLDVARQLRKIVLDMIAEPTAKNQPF